MSTQKGFRIGTAAAIAAVVLLPQSAVALSPRQVADINDAWQICMTHADLPATIAKYGRILTDEMGYANWVFDTDWDEACQAVENVARQTATERARLESKRERDLVNRISRDAR